MLSDYGYSSEAGFDSAGDVNQSITADSAAAAQGAPQFKAFVTVGIGALAESDAAAP